MIPKHDLLAAIHRGIRDAHRQYKKWAGGWWMSGYAVEEFMTTHIAQRIMAHKNKQMYLTLETTFKDLRSNDSVATPRGRKCADSKDPNKMDIAVYSKGWDLNYLIEVKRAHPMKHKACAGDIRRLAKLTRQYTKGDCHLKASVFAHYVYCSKQTRRDLDPEKELFDPWCEGHFSWLSSTLKKVAGDSITAELQSRFIDTYEAKNEKGQRVVEACGSAVFVMKAQ